MAPVVPLPTGNVTVLAELQQAGRLPTQRAHDLVALTGADGDGSDDAPIGWSIRHPDGEVVRSHIAQRADASRMLGRLAAHGEPLPLVVYGPDDQPTGDRLG